MSAAVPDDLPVEGSDSRRDSTQEQPDGRAKDDGGQHHDHHHHRHHHASHHCPACGSSRVRRAHRQGFFDVWLAPLLLRRPFQCGRCAHRYYEFSTGSKTLRRAWLSLLITALIGAVALGVAKLIQFYTESTPTLPPPP